MGGHQRQRPGEAQIAAVIDRRGGLVHRRRGAGDLHRPSGRDQDWYAYYTGKGTTLPSALTGPRRVKIHMQVEVGMSQTNGRLGTTFRIATAVGPTDLTNGKKVYLQRYADKKWTTVDTKTLSRSKTVTFSVRPTKKGTHIYRVHKPAQGEILAGSSHTMRIYVY